MGRPLGSAHSPETRAKMSNTRRGRPHSPEHREAITQAVRRHWANRPKVVHPPAEIAEKARIKKLKERFGLTADQYDEMLAAQGGACAVCGRTEGQPHNQTGLPTRLVVDHDHQTGVNRGLLCRQCNLGIGNLKDSPALLRAAAAYLERHVAS